MSGIESTITTITYRWTKINGTTQMTVDTHSSILSFSPLKLSDAGQYICEATIGSQMYGSIEYIYIQSELSTHKGLVLATNIFMLFFSTTLVSAPRYINSVSDPVSPIQPIGSNVTLTCTVELSPAVDVPVIVNIKLTDPSGKLLPATTPSVSVSGSIYTSKVMIASFRRNQSGVYSYVSTINSSYSSLIDSRPQSSTLLVTVGK